MSDIPTEVLALIIAIASFVGVIVGPILSNIIALIAQAKERREARRTQRFEYLKERLNLLTDVRADIAAKSARTAHEHEKVSEVRGLYAKAAGILLSVSDTRLDSLSLLAGDRNTGAIEDGISRLGEMLADVTRNKKL